MHADLDMLALADHFLQRLGVRHLCKVDVIVVLILLQLEINSLYDAESRRRHSAALHEYFNSTGALSLATFSPSMSGRMCAVCAALSTSLPSLT